MSVRLNSPKQSVSLDRARIASVKFEKNPGIGQQWIEVWIVLGMQEIPGDDSTFRQYADPETGETVYAYLKFEDGMNPLRPGMMLGKCDACNLWSPTNGGPCEMTDGCTGSIISYDGRTRLVEKQVTVGQMERIVWNALYGFLRSERVPDPETWQVRRLLNTQAAR